MAARLRKPKQGSDERAKQTVEEIFEWTDDLIDAFAFGSGGQPTVPVYYPSDQVDSSRNTAKKKALKSTQYPKSSSLREGALDNQTARNKPRSPDKSKALTSKGKTGVFPSKGSPSNRAGNHTSEGLSRGLAASTSKLQSTCPEDKKIESSVHAGTSSPSIFEMLLKDEEENRLRPKRKGGGGPRGPSGTSGPASLLKSLGAPPRAQEPAPMPQQLTMADRLQQNKQRERHHRSGKMDAEELRNSRGSVSKLGKNGLRGKLDPRFAVHQPSTLPLSPEEALARRRHREMNLERFLAEILSAEMEEENSKALLPLHFFDDVDYESKRPEEWIESGKKNGYDEATLDAVAFCVTHDDDGPTKPIFNRCVVTRFEKERDVYEITWFGSLQVDHLPRLYVCFYVEDRFIYVQRMRAAFERRRRCEALLRYWLFIEAMPVDADICGTLEDQQARKILNKLSSRINLTMFSHSVASLLEEARNKYEMVMNRLVFDANFMNPTNLSEFLTLTSCPPPFAKPLPVPTCGVVYNERYSPDKFLDMLDCFRDATLLLHPVGLAVVQNVRADNLRISSIRLLLSKHKESMRLDSFRKLQDDNLSKTCHQVKTEWSNDITFSIRSALGTADPALYNLEEGNLKNYLAPNCRLRRLLNRVNFTMTDILLDLTRDSLEEYADYIHRITAAELEVKSSCEVILKYIDKNGTLSTASSLEFEPLEPPLFRLELQPSEQTYVINQEDIDAARAKVKAWRESDDAKEEGAKCPVKVPEPVRGHRFEYDVPLNNFCDAVVAVFESAVTELQEIPHCKRNVMEHMFWPDGDLIAAVGMNEPWVKDLREKIRADMNRAVQPLDCFLNAYLTWIDFLNEDTEEYLDGLGHVKGLPKDGDDATIESSQQSLATADEENLVKVDIPKLRLLLLKHTKEQQEVLRQIPSNPVNAGLFSVSTRGIRDLLANKHKQILKSLLDLHERCCSQLSDFLIAKFEEIKARLKKKPKTIEEVAAMEEYLTQVPIIVSPLEDKIVEMMEWNAVLDDFRHMVPEAHSKAKWTSFGWPLLISKVSETCAENLKDYRSKYYEEMISEQERFTQTLELLELEVAEFADHQDLSKVEAVAARVKETGKKLEEADEKARLFNSREGIFQCDVTDYEVLSRIKKAFEPYNNLWSTTHQWLHSYEAWTKGAFIQLNAEALEEDVNSMSTAISKAFKFFEKTGKGLLASIAEKIKNQVGTFKPVVPLVVALRNPGMRARHWGELSHKVGLPLAPTETTTLEGLMQLDLLDHLESITKVAEAAGKEYQIQQALEKMYGEWEHLTLDIHAYKDTGTGILKGVDEINQVLDEHVTMTQAMQFSSFKGPFEVDIDEWNKKLYMVSEVLEAWLAVQRNWLYLQPIFESPDINKQLPTEGKKFALVDKNWRQAISAAKSSSKVIEYCNNEKLLEKFKEGVILLDQVQKGLSDYLETKRSVFARLYFLSNDELLSILSESKDVMRVQPHLKKCFEGIDKVNFINDLIIDAMVSPEQEKVMFIEQIDPKGKNVEVWMLLVEEFMRKSVRDVMHKAIQDYPVRSRTKWMQHWPGMCVLNGSQLWWTHETEEFLAKEGAMGPQMALDKQLEQLKDMVVLVRGELSKGARTTVGALTVIDVHARDVMIKLVNARVESKSDFLWTSQLRYYWDNDLFAEMVAARRPYGYEYLGNSFRLVITPLTDKCYLTLMGALQMILGGAPAGPAGTGKTETTKDLSKALAMQCVVFNCSDGLDYIAMGKFFKGLASCGAWACFDEFNRINIEVLSVIGQQIMTIQLALKRFEKTLQFEGSQIALSAGFGVFITMNPGYAGRSDLPDSLKALFRPVAMMVPDYALIGEIMFFAYGFEYAKDLGAKMVTTFKLCSEQLSAQPHYDYGMRAVKTVITAAGNLKRAEPHADEFVVLLRALQDVNYPKFLEMDLPLFEGIISDLFPGKKRPELDYGALNATMKLEIEEQNLQVSGFFVQKVIQLYEMIVVRHGLMLVGPTGGGKSANLHILEKTLGSLKKQGIKGFAYEKVKIYQLNPKSITMGQMYGEFDQNTHEWQDGIMSTMYREACQSTSPDRKWVMFNGPVDAIWIENMNTVLDDNKKLCLNSGEIIKMSPEMTMMFEVEDLLVASPATVSRVGIIYMEPKGLGLDPLVQSWLALLPEILPVECKRTLSVLFDVYLQPVCDFMRMYLKELVPTVNNNLAMSCMRLMDCYLERYRPKEGVDPPDAKQLKAISLSIEAYFIFSIIWSIGATTNETGRTMFSAFIRSYMSSLGSSWQFPKEETVYDYVFDIDGGRWRGWMEVVSEFKVDSKVSFSEIIVPTVDSIRNSFLLNLLISNNKHLLMVGPTGTGKTINITQYLSGKETVKGAIISQNCIPLSITFSAQTSANMTQDMLDSKMEKRRKGVFGPPSGKQFVVHVDDLNMPKREEYGAQPPIEMLRQWFDQHGWYDRKELVFRRIVDLTFVASMGPPGGGRQEITPRFLRHFNIIGYVDMSKESQSLIFGSILADFLKNFEGNIQNLCSTMVTSTVNIFEAIKKELLPTPSKIHYTFNLRDLAKVFQGVLMIDPKSLSQPEQLVRLWVHECSRVFEDRLINKDDHKWFQNYQRLLVSRNFKLEWSTVVTSERLIYGDYMVPGADPRMYVEVSDMNELKHTMDEYLFDHNAESKSPMPLVMFLDAIEHVSRIARVLRQPQGNALLLGVGGSGRQSMTKLATFLSGYQLFQVEIKKGYSMSDWREDVKSCLKRAALKEKPTTFLFNDAQIVDEGMLEDINNILNSGDVPNLYAAEDMDEILNVCKVDCQRRRLQATKLNIFGQYIRRVRSNLHVVVCMSPLGTAFRDSLRMFPSLVNCCTIDWFTDWPPEALVAVADSVLGDAEDLAEHKDNVVSMFQAMHAKVQDTSIEYWDTLRRHNYVTPTSYLTLLGTFSRMMKFKVNEVNGMRKRLQIGLDMLSKTKLEVDGMKEELTQLQPVLERTNKEVSKMMVTLTVEKKDAEEKRVVVEAQEKEANAKASATKEIADDAQRDLDKALPALDAALECLNSLKKSDIDEVKSLRTPPAGVVLTMEVICNMFQIKPVKKNDPNNPGKKINDYLEAARMSILSDPKSMLEQLFAYDKDHIPDKVIKAVEPFVKDPAFTPEAIQKASQACRALCMWVHAMYTYHFVALGVAPKRAALAEAQGELEEVLAELNEAKAQLKAVIDKLHELEENYNNAVIKKQELAEKAEKCKVQLSNAAKLIGGLGGEEIRWMKTVQDLNISYNNLVGDVLVSAGTISYLGPFTFDFRTKVTISWQEMLVHKLIPHTPHCDLERTMGNPVEIRSWNLNSLPTDQLSTQNGIIMARSNRWALLIDPQGQANRFIKTMGKNPEFCENGMDVVKMSDKNFLRGLENGVRFGKWVLMENIGEELDASLEPILLQLKFKQGGQEMIRIGDNTIPYNDSFKFYMTTKLPNPHYAPEVQVKVNLLNFTITETGLEEQLLNITVQEEMPELAEKKNELVTMNAAANKQLYDIESQILLLLSSAEGNILDNTDLIDTLATAKNKSEEIKQQMKESEETEKEIVVTSEKYRPVAKRASLLYFCIASLRDVDPMYQYALPWFIQLFIKGIGQAPQSNDLYIRLDNLNSFFTYSLYVNICRSLFEKHKLLFSFLLTIKILQGDDLVNMLEWRFMISGMSMSGTPKENLHNPDPEWIEPNVWNEVLTLGTLPTFTNFALEFGSSSLKWRKVFDATSPETAEFPTPYEKLMGLKRLCILRCLRLDKCMDGILNFVVDTMEQKFVEPPPFDIRGCYEDSAPTTPLVFVLSTGSDPNKDLLQFAGEMSQKVQSIALGQGQGQIAHNLVQKGFETGDWILLQNCHLALSWMPELEKICDDFEPDKINKSFRLWLTSMPTPVFPTLVLQMSVKMTKEPPKGLKANLKSTYLKMTDEDLNRTKKPVDFRKMLFGLCFYHALCIERKKFGPLGWNVPYEFNETDLDISRAQLELYMDEYDEIPYQVLQQLVSVVNYGGRITDDKDMRTSDIIVGDFFTPEILTEGYTFSRSGIYFSIVADRDAPLQSYLEYIETLPLVPDPEAFGMHDNANITCAITETDENFGIIVALQPRVGGGTGTSREDQIAAIAKDLEARLPAMFDVEQTSMRYPTDYHESMNTVLVQEIQRYNRLLAIMVSSLKDVQKALKGLVLLSAELEQMGDNMFNQLVPALWQGKSYPSLKPLTSWYADLLRRVKFLADWIEDGVPSVFWISGFFFPQGFMTGIVQNYARKYHLPIDTVSLGFAMLDESAGELTSKPRDGAYIDGLFLEGARWDKRRKTLIDPKPKELFSPMPIIHLQPQQHREQPQGGIYRCPVYKILTRTGTLSTTGHSTNFVTWIEIPSNKATVWRSSLVSETNAQVKFCDQDYWIKAGVACFCALRY